MVLAVDQQGIHLGDGCLFLMVIVFISMKTIHNLKVPFFFFINRTRHPMMEHLDGLINIFCDNSSD